MGRDGSLRRLFGICACAAALLQCAGAPRRAALEPEEYAAVLEDRAAFRSELERSCSELSLADDIVSRAIEIGAPIYNAGSPLGCYRIYEGAAYKLLDQLEGRCNRLRAFLRAGLAKAESDRSLADKAWTLRRTFDALLGEATSYAEPREPLL